jgi:hypothetical protein
MLWHPAESAARFCPAQLLVEREAPRPIAQLSGVLVCGNDPRFAIGGTKAPRKSQGNAPHRNTFNGRANVTFPRDTPFQRKGIQIGEIVTMHQRPAHTLTSHDTHRAPVTGVTSEVAEHTSGGFVDHGRVYDNGFDARRIEQPLQVRQGPSIPRQRRQRSRLSCDTVAGCAKESTAPGVKKFCLVSLHFKPR